MKCKKREIWEKKVEKRNGNLRKKLIQEKTKKKDREKKETERERQMEKKTYAPLK